MKKKILCLAAGLGLVATAALATAGASSSIIRADETKVEWRHYNAVKATPSSNGSLAYWVSCADHTVQFTEPTGNVNIVDKGDVHDDENWLGSLKDYEARYTAYVPNVFKNGESFSWRYFRHNGFGTSDYANGVFNITSNGTVNYELIKDAHELGIKYLYFHINAVASEGGSEITSVPFTTSTYSGDGKFHDGNTWIEDPNSYDGVRRGNGNGVIISVDDWYSSSNAEKYKDMKKLDEKGELVNDPQTVFAFEARIGGTKTDAFDHLSLRSLETFDTLEQAVAFKSLDKVLESNPWDYFRYGTTPTGSGDEFVFTSDSTSLTLTKKFVENAKAAGKKKVSFKVKMSTGDETLPITTVYAQSSYAGGTDANGDAVSYKTDFSAYDYSSDGITVTLNLEKLFGENVTFGNGGEDYAYNISGRVEGGSDTYKKDGAKATVTVSDFKYE